MSITLTILLSVLAVGILSMLGMGLVTISKERFERTHTYLFALAIGALSANAILHMLPDAYDYLASSLVTGGVCLAGFLFLAILDLAGTEDRLAKLTKRNFLTPVIAFFVISDSVHNFFDGSIIALSYMADMDTGLHTTIAVATHEVPLELVEWSLMLGVGISLKRALALNLFSALFAVMGASLTIVLGAENQNMVFYLLPFVAGSFLYISFIKLLPRLSISGVKGLLLHLLAGGLGALLMMEWIHH